MKKLDTEKMLRIYVLVSSVLIILMLAGIVSTFIVMQHNNKAVNDRLDSISNDAGEAANDARQANDKADDALSKVNDVGDEADNICSALPACL